MSMSQSDYTIAIVCAMSFEMSAVRYMLDKEDAERLPRQPGDDNTYILGQMRDHNVVLACLPGQQGKSAATMVATNLARTFPLIKLRLFVGIGGGVPSLENDVRLGDVVVGMPAGQYGGVVQYDLGKRIGCEDPSEGFVLKGFLRPPPQTLAGVVEVMRSDHLGQDNKIPDFVGEMLGKYRKLVQFKRPSNDLDILFEADYPHVKSSMPCQGNCDSSRAVKRPVRYDPSESVIHYGLIASGDSVIKDARQRDDIARRVGGNVLSFEMEAAGLMTGYECLVVRGISDYCDTHKNDAWHHYAAAAAAACAKEIIERLGPDSAPNSESWKSQNMSSWARNQNLLESGTPHPQDLDGTGRQSQSNVLSGRGIQNTGSGSFSVGGNVNIA